MKAVDRFMPGKVKLVSREGLTAKSLSIRATLEKDGAGTDLLWFKGYANTPTIDRDEELILNAAHVNAIPKFLAGTPAITLGHEFRAEVAPNIGTVTDASVDEKGLWVEGYIGTNEYAKAIRQNLKEGIPVDFSIAFMDAERRDPTEQEVQAHGTKLRRVVTAYEMLNIGAVNIGSNRGSHMSARGVKAAAPAQAASGLTDLASIAAAMQQGMELMGEAAALFAQCMDAMQTEEMGEPDPAAPPDPNADPNAGKSEEWEPGAVAAAERIIKGLNEADSKDSNPASGGN